MNNPNSYTQTIGNFPHHHLKRRVSVSQKLLEVGLGLSVFDPFEEIDNHTWNQVPASGAGCRASLYPQCASYRGEEELDVPSLSPPGLTHTKASSSGSPVLVVGRTPKPVPMTLHQSPQAFCLVGWTPLRAEDVN